MRTPAPTPQSSKVGYTARSVPLFLSSSRFSHWLLWSKGSMEECQSRLELDSKVIRLHHVINYHVTRYTVEKWSRGGCPSLFKPKLNSNPTNQAKLFSNCINFSPFICKTITSFILSKLTDIITILNLLARMFSKLVCLFITWLYMWRQINLHKKLWNHATDWNTVNQDSNINQNAWINNIQYTQSRVVQLTFQYTA